MTISTQPPFESSRDSYPDLYTRLASAVTFLNSKGAAAPGTEFVLSVAQGTNRQIVQIVEVESGQIIQELPNSTIFALVNKVHRRAADIT